MSYLKSTSELKNEVLQACGELTDGTSPYEETVLIYLNDVYQGVIAGGNEFGIDVAEPWAWAQAKKPIVMSLDPAVTGSATLTNNSRSGTFSSAPTISLTGRYFRVDSRADVYRIAAHTASSTSFSLDQVYLDDSGTLNYTAYKLDYDVADDTIVINSTNKYIDFSIGVGSNYAIALTEGIYTPTTLASAIEVAMETAVGSLRVFLCSFNSVTRKFSIGSSATYFALQFKTGANAMNSIASVIGYDVEDYLAEASPYVAGQIITYIYGVYSLSGVTRLTKPITMYREAPAYAQASKDVGKIFMIDDNTFLREYPINRLTQDVPDKFCVIENNPYGLWKIRFNASVLEDPIRIEVNYIPVTRKLTDSVNSLPILPGSYSKYLVYGAAYYLMLDKSDGKAEMFAKLANSKLLAMVNDNRKGVSLAGNNFGRLIPRLGYNKIWGWSR